MKKYILLLITAITFGQASNQMITFTQAQGLGFALKSGQSHITSNQCMTKLDILTKYNVTISGYTDNQLVPRSAWANAVAYYTYQISSSGTEGNPNATCSSYSLPYPLYSGYSSIQYPMYLYTNTTLTTPYSGRNLTYYYAGTNELIVINDSGLVTGATSCVATDTTPPSTPTNLTGNQISANEVTLTWSASSDNVGVSQYYIYQSTTQESGPYSFVTSSTSTGITIGGLSSNVQYWFAVRALDTSNNISGYSGSVYIYMIN